MRGGAPLSSTSSSSTRFSSTLQPASLLGAFGLFGGGDVDVKAVAQKPTPVDGIKQNKPAEVATLAGGCFWGLEKYFRNQFGKKLKSTWVGYVGGEKANPTYEQVCSGRTGHAEAIQIEYFPDEVAYEELLEFFWKLHDPTTPNRQGNDVGTQYRSAVFFHSPEQKEAAAKVMGEVQPKWKNKISTEIVEGKPEDFWPAEGYHQMYLFSNPMGYCNHRPRW